MDINITGCIVLYDNNAEMLKRVIDSFLNTTLNVKLFLIDNSYSDRLRDIATDNRIDYFHNPSNPGFGTSHNIAILKAIDLKSKYHLILNPDIYFDKEVTNTLFEYGEIHPNIGLMMPLVLYPNGSIQHLCRLLPSPSGLFFRRFFSKFNFVKKIKEKSELKFTGYNKIINVPYLSGCFMFCRTEVLSEIGGFDERFFMYMEDVDLSRRIHKRYNTVFYPNVKIYHNFEKASFKNLKMFKYHIISAIKYFNKWGWIFDIERIKINRQCLKNLK
ncbi:glycosyltransferase family 2 protein [Sediminicola arcticus]|jgi:GT2 family glycosyltransferase|uniref:Glycosyltransferase family 2 protein n=1 Tax=Sediminicola arcticus TaxID=1574308 RepID=A0ABV2SQW2_9FLAO